MGGSVQDAETKIQEHRVRTLELDFTWSRKNFKIFIYQRNSWIINEKQHFCSGFA